MKVTQSNIVGTGRTGTYEAAEHTSEENEQVITKKQNTQTKQQYTDISSQGDTLEISEESKNMVRKKEVAGEEEAMESGSLT